MAEGWAGPSQVEGTPSTLVHISQRHTSLKAFSQPGWPFIEEVKLHQLSVTWTEMSQTHPLLTSVTSVAKQSLKIQEPFTLALNLVCVV